MEIYKKKNRILEDRNYLLILMTFLFCLILISCYDTNNEKAEKETFESSDNIIQKIEASSNVWSTTEVVSSESTANSFLPSIGIDNNENVHVVWMDYSNIGGPGTDILYKFKNVSTSTWNSSELVSIESSSDSNRPKVELDDNNNVHIVWEDKTNYLGSGSDYDIFYKMKNVSSDLWTTAEVISSGSGADSTDSSIGIDSTGNIHVVWEDDSGPDEDILYKVKNISTGIWAPVEIVSTQSTGNSLCPSIAIDNSDNIHVAWHDSTDYGGAGPHTDIFYKKKPKGGSWSNTELVSKQSTAPAFKPSITVEDSGNVHIAWTDLTDFGGGLGERVVYKRRIFSSGSWTNTQILGGGRDVALSIDAIGNIHVVWSGVTYKCWISSSGIWTPNKRIDWETQAGGYCPAIKAFGTEKAHVVWYGLSDYGNSGNDNDIFYKNNFEEATMVQPILINGNQGWINFKNSGGCTGQGTSSNPYIIENLEINGLDSSNCIKIANSDVYFVIRNCILYNSGGNEVPYGTAAIKLVSVKNGQILNNNCSDSWTGIILQGDFGTKQCENNIVSANIVENNFNGGIRIIDSLNNQITNNLVINHRDYGSGISILASNYNTFTGNTINNSIGYGLSSQSSDDNLIYKNYLWQNDLGNGRESMSSNYWDNGSIGNFWDDYMGADADDDGIGDSYYTIIGGNRDNYPIYEDGDDNAPPNITIRSPKKNQVFGFSAPEFKVSIKGLYLDYIWYSVVGESLNYTCNNTGQIDKDLWDSYGNGTVIFRFYANDSLGNIDFDEITILKDIISPNINITSPIDGELFGKIAPNFTIKVNETNLDTLWYTLDGGLTNITFTDNETIDSIEWSKLKNGTHLIYFYVNDSGGNLAISSVEIHLDIIEPTISINSPLGGKSYKNSPQFNVRINDTNIHKRWYTLGLDPLKYFFTDNETIDPLAWSTFIDGPITITFYANDTVGNINSTARIIIKDTSTPTITIVSPFEGKVLNSTAPLFIVEIFDYSLNKTWYSLNGSKFIEFLVNETFNSAEWNKIQNGTFTITFYANDSFGHEFSQVINLRKDIEKPILTIFEPYLEELCGIQAPEFNISVSEGNLHSTWYCLVNFSDLSDFTLNETFDLLTENVISQTFWDEMDNGTIILWFFANDTMGNIGYKQIIVNKDIISPLITIIDPKPELEYGKTPPDFEIIITEGNLNTTWYTINGGSIKYMFSKLNGTINQEIWGNLDEGSIILTFWANDTMDNIGYKEITITKNLPEPPSSGGGGGGGGGGGSGDDDASTIPFGNYHLIYIFLAIISLITIIKKKNLLKMD